MILLEIYRKDNATYAVKGRDVAEAVCGPKDEFDQETGARLATARFLTGRTPIWFNGVPAGATFAGEVFVNAEKALRGLVTLAMIDGQAFGLRSVDPSRPSRRAWNDERLTAKIDGLTFLGFSPQEAQDE